MEIFGTSHVSQDSVDEIERVIDERQPDIVAIELDANRLQALLTGEQGTGGAFFIRMLRYFQKRIGSKTGVMPGTEMLRAYRKAQEIDADVALIDQNISKTLERLRQVPRKEKVRAAAGVGLGAVFGTGFDVSKVPEEDEVQMLLSEVAENYPHIYRVLVEERDDYMAIALEHLREQNPEAEIVAFVGAGHESSLERKLGIGEEKEETETEGSLEDFV